MTLPAVNEWIQHEAKTHVIEIKGTMQSSGGKRLRLRQNIHVRPWQSSTIRDRAV